MVYDIFFMLFFILIFFSPKKKFIHLLASSILRMQVIYLVMIDHEKKLSYTRFKPQVVEVPDWCKTTKTQQLIFRGQIHPLVLFWICFRKCILNIEDASICMNFFIGKKSESTITRREDWIHLAFLQSLNIIWRRMVVVLYQ